MTSITKADIFKISSDEDFRHMAMNIFKYQVKNLPVYKDYLFYLHKDPAEITTIEQIPFFFFFFFKKRKVYDVQMPAPEIEFSSSGTTATQTSRHAVADLHLYEESFRLGFLRAYGPIENYIVLALLPSYLEREGSSLVYMCDKLIKWSNDERSGFYLNDYAKIREIIIGNSNKQVLLIGVSFALLDFAESAPFAMERTTMMETGGMKGRRAEMIREELHAILQAKFHLSQIHSEYGMTELLSQAYSKADGWYEHPPWMQILIREIHDPFSYCSIGKTGGINVIDLANLHSCSFIATQDLGSINNYNQFKVLGRFDHSDVRGCNLLV